MDCESIMSESYGGINVTTGTSASGDGGEMGPDSPPVCPGEGRPDAPQSDRCDVDYVYHVDHRRIEQNIIAMMRKIHR